ncbi:MAG: RidA family protein [Planctomycetes bacterium]|jgi:2-iminobutanoate/2-iminopropanoate deaminase|nr:RidA family protein [Planctomycetota bacterium]MBT4028324.1 RidA family protein [Planctomycetota bacterium]MBT4560883.1 RidA family protein [Planctomycetota bacterium]MBT5120430.1 RidA family protein [Planctomycetota bacterium]MBT7012698.1 RidA family protein [Planctomycetota bacterium]
MKTISTDQAPAAIGPYSQAMQTGDFLYTSGQIALNAAGDLCQGDVGEQTHQVFDNLRSVLAAAGCTLSDVVKTTVFLADMGEFGIVNEIYAGAFGDHRPARSTVEVARLPLDVRVEIEVIARVP